MGLKIMLMTGFVLVLIVGFCIAGAVAGEADNPDNTPVTVTFYESFHSIIEWFTGTDENTAVQSGPDEGS